MKEQVGLVLKQTAEVK